MSLDYADLIEKTLFFIGFFINLAVQFLSVEIHIPVPNIEIFLPLYAVIGFAFALAGAFSGVTLMLRKR